MIDSSLKTRLKSALVFGPAVLLMLYAGGMAFGLMMAAAAAIGVYEWSRMVMTGQKDVPPWLARFAGGLTGLGVAAGGMVDNPVTALWFLLALCFLVFAANFSRQGPSARLLLAGMVYIGFSVDIMIWLRAGTSMHGLYNVVTLLFVVWGSDVFAYFVGRAIGGPKLAPHVSPKKTWAGLCGGMAGAALIAAALACPQLTQWLDVDTLGGMTWRGYAFMGAVFGALGQGGDLMVSAFKRHYGVKDTGTLIPGHGGILDRIDALLFVAYPFGCLAVVTL